jgi:putative hydrolase of the HAD superfamily
MKVLAVTLDFWGTLVLDAPASDEEHREQRLDDVATLLGTAGLPVARDVLARAYDTFSARLARVWARLRDVPVGEHVQMILAAADPALEGRVPRRLMHELVEAYARPALLAPPAFDEGGLAALERLRERGCALAVVSNTMRTPGAMLRALLARQGLLRLFDHVTFSDEVGVRKPAPEIFSLTLRALGREAGAAVHVGDDALLDVAGARTAGMRAIQVLERGRTGPRLWNPDAVIPTLAALPEAIVRLEERE